MSSKVQLILIFGLFAIISNFTGIEIAKNQIVPNNLLTYLSKECFHCEYAYVSNWRFWISGWSDCRQYSWFNCGFHRVIQGGGIVSFMCRFFNCWLNCRFLGSRMAKQTVFPSAGFSAIVGACMEMIQMIFIFFFSGDLADGATLVRFIAPPMILLNSVGTFILCRF